MLRTRVKKILYIIPPLTSGTPLAVRINIAQRSRLLKRMGYETTQLPYRGAWSLSGWRNLIQQAGQADILMIRVDGSCVGDMYTVIKLLRPKMRVIWEVHGFPEENAVSEKVIVRHIIKKYMRMALSLLVENCIYVSDELMRFSVSRLLARHHTVIPNFVSVHSSHFSSRASALPAPVQKRIAHKFVVLWGGSPQFPWQGIDIIEKLAAYVEQIDPEVLFVVAGKNSWHTLPKSRNIMHIDNLKRSAYLSLMKKSDVCMALYHKPPQIPLYFFPMKVLDYMYYKRPVICSSYPVAASIITHGSDGFLVPNDIGEITFSIMKLKNNAALRRTIGNAAHRTVTARFSDRQAMQAYTAVFA